MLIDFLDQVATHQQTSIVRHDWGSILAQMLSGLQQERHLPIDRIDRVILAAVPPLRTFARRVNPRQMVRSRYMFYFVRCLRVDPAG